MPKRPRRGEDSLRDPDLEEKKVRALEAIALGLDRVSSVLERVEEETRVRGDLAALQAFKEVDLPIDEWDRRECFTEYVIKESKKWIEDKLRGKNVEGNL